MPETTPKLRVARPTNDLAALLPFYRDGLGLTVLTSFSGHDGFDGIMLGMAEAPWHLEFTQAAGHIAAPAPSEDHLLVIYLPDRAAWQAACARMEAAGHAPVASCNPYWDRQGRTYQDPEGYRVVLQQQEWPL
jgi:catechol 2,3-dioxygenase-like lactoylglutathione lyase family enzyme